MDVAREEMGENFTQEIEDKFNEVLKANGKVTMKDFKDSFPDTYRNMAEAMMMARFAKPVCKEICFI